MKALRCLCAIDICCKGFTVLGRSRSYGRWVHRIPKSVISSESTQKDEVEVKRSIEMECLRDTGKQSEMRLSTQERNKQNFDQFELKTAKDLFVHKGDPPRENTFPSKLKIPNKSSNISNKLVQSAAALGVPVFTKLKNDDPKLSTVMLAVKSTKKSRSKVLLEGSRLIQDCIDAGFTPEMIFFTMVGDIQQMNLPPSGIELYKVPYKDLSLWSTLSTCPGIMGIVKVPAVDEIKPARDSLPFILICDNIRDPGNLGSVLRTAAGVGCRKVILTKGCVDIWNSKVLRGGSGAHFRIPIHENVSWDHMDELLDKNASVFLADNSPEERSIKMIKNSETLQNVEDSLTCEKDKTIPGSEESPLSEIPLRLPIEPYNRVNFISKSSVVLILGGETVGLTVAALKFAREWKGIRVIVPLSNNLESLNLGTALGIISFEVKRQFCESMNK